MKECAKCILITGIFVFPVWYVAACELNRPVDEDDPVRLTPGARCMHITSLVLAVLWSIWLPVVIIWAALLASN